MQITGCNLQLIRKNSMQSLQKVEPSSTLCNCCKPKNVAGQVAKRACYTLQPTYNLSCNAIATQVSKKIAPRNTSCIARFYFLQRLQRLFKPLQVGASDRNVFLKPLQVTAQDCNVYHVSCNLQWISFSNVARQVARKL